MPTTDQHDYPYDEQLAPAIPHLPALDFNDVSAARAGAADLAALAGPIDLTGVSFRDVQIPVSADATITLRITTPDGASHPLPVIFDIHPGGFSVGGVDDVQPRDTVLAREVGAIVVAVDFRLAPEHAYPIPLDDCYAGLMWVVEHADELGADAEKIAVYGMSGGGGLAAGLTLLARDRGTPRVHFQYLAFPEIDDRLETGSVNGIVGAPFLDRANALGSWKNYLGALEPGSADVPIYAAPARATDLSGLPPTYIGVMQFDPLRDEGIAYAQKLLDADVPVELHLFPGTFHFSRAIDTAEVSQRELSEEIAVLTRALHGVTKAAD